jgi:hypothetical protein
VCAPQAFLQKALMPLHKPKGLGVYQQQLSYCVTQVHPPPPGCFSVALFAWHYLSLGSTCVSEFLLVHAQSVVRSHQTAARVCDRWSPATGMS